MAEHGKGIRVTNCPIKQEYCDSSCHWWANNECSYDAYCRKGLEDLRAMNEASRLYQPDKR